MFISTISAPTVPHSDEKRCLLCGKPASLGAPLLLEGYSDMGVRLAGGIETHVCQKCFSQHATPAKLKSTFFMIAAVLGILMCIGLVVLVIATPRTSIGLLGVLMMGYFVSMCFKKAGESADVLSVSNNLTDPVALAKMIGAVPVSRKIIPQQDVIFEFSALKEVLINGKEVTCETVSRPITLEPYYQYHLRTMNGLLTTLTTEESNAIQELMSQK